MVNKGFKQTIEHIRKRVVATKNYWENNKDRERPIPPSRKGKTQVAWNKGLTGTYNHSEETKKQISIRMKKENPMFNKEIRRKMSLSSKGKRFSKEHKQKLRLASLGEKGNNWQGGKTKKMTLLRNSARYLEWRRLVFERDNYTCQRCGGRSSKGNKVILNSHHLIQVSKDVGLMFNLDNGLTLCLPCHKEIHSGIKQEEKIEQWS